MEDDGLCFNFPVLYINLVPAEDDGDILTDAHQITVPVGDVLVRHSRRHVKHNDGAMSLDIITVSEAAQLLLTSCVPNIESGRGRMEAG